MLKSAFGELCPKKNLNMKLGELRLCYKLVVDELRSRYNLEIVIVLSGCYVYHVYILFIISYIIPTNIIYYKSICKQYTDYRLECIKIISFNILLV